MLSRALLQRITPQSVLTCKNTHTVFKQEFANLRYFSKRTSRSRVVFSPTSTLTGTLAQTLARPTSVHLLQRREASSFNKITSSQVKTYLLLGAVGIVGLWVVWKIGAFIVSMVLIGVTIYAGKKIYDNLKPGGPKAVASPFPGTDPADILRANLGNLRGVPATLARLFPAAAIGLMTRLIPLIQNSIRHGLQGGDRVGEVTYRKVLNDDEVARLLGTELAPDSDAEAIEIEYDGDKTKGRLQFTVRGTRGVGLVTADFSYNPDELSNKSLEDIIKYKKLTIETSTGHKVNLIRKSKDNNPKKPNSSSGDNVVDAEYVVLPKKK